MRLISQRPFSASFPALFFGLLLLASASWAIVDYLPDVQRLMKAGQWSQALEKVDAHLASQPKEAQGRFLKGVILTEMGRPAEAIVIFNRLAEDYPELPEPYNNLAVLYAQQKQYDKARTALEMAIRTHPSYSIAHENLGDVYAKLASQAYDKALQLDSSNQATQSKLSMIRELIGTSSRASVKPGAAVPAADDAGKRAAVQPTRAPPVTAAPVPPPTAQTAPTAPAGKPSEPPPAKAVDRGAGISVGKPMAATPAERAPPAPSPRVATAPPAPPESPPPPAEQVGVRAALQAWAKAWSDKNMKVYLAHYADDFRTPRGMSRKAWDAQRRKRIDKPGRIQVDLEEITISFADNKATVSFKQHYTSDKLESTVRKTLVFVKKRGKWLIEQERVD
mgnify:CR=1 FL=1